MIKGSVKVSVVNNNVTKMRQKWLQISQNQIYVGVPEQQTNRKSGELTNAQLVFLHTHGVRTVKMIAAMKSTLAKGTPYNVAMQMYIHSHGSPLWRIPPRPIIEPAIEAPRNKALLASKFKDIGKALLEGNQTLAMQEMWRTGQLGIDIVKNWFFDPDNKWPPLSKITIARRKNHSAQPLIEPGQMHNAIKYVID